MIARLIRGDLSAQERDRFEDFAAIFGSLVIAGCWLYAVAGAL